MCDPATTPLQVAGGQLPGKMDEFGQDTPSVRRVSRQSMRHFSSCLVRAKLLIPMEAYLVPMAAQAQSERR